MAQNETNKKQKRVKYSCRVTIGLTHEMYTELIKRSRADYLNLQEVIRFALSQHLKKS